MKKEEMKARAIEEVKTAENAEKLRHIYDEFRSALINLDIDGGAEVMEEIFYTFSAETFAVLGWYLDKVSHRFEERATNDEIPGIMDKLETVAEVVEKLEDED